MVDRGDYDVTLGVTTTFLISVELTAAWDALLIISVERLDGWSSFVHRMGVPSCLIVTLLMESGSNIIWVCTVNMSMMVLNRQNLVFSFININHLR